MGPGHGARGGDALASVKEAAGGYAHRTLYNKLTGKSHFTYPEYLKLRELFPDRNIDYLLTAEQDSA